MKRIFRFLECLGILIKKNFFIKEKHDIPHDCKNVFEMNKKVENNVAEKEAEEYITNYNSTTRWQTV